MTYYCSREHQQSDWKTHKNLCGKLEKKREELENKDPLIDEDINDILSQHQIFLSNFEKDKKELGLDNTKTLTSAFKLIDSYISNFFFFINCFWMFSFEKENFFNLTTLFS